jgi:hypothetical protein
VDTRPDTVCLALEHAPEENATTRTVKSTHAADRDAMLTLLMTTRPRRLPRRQALRRSAEARPTVAPGSQAFEVPRSRAARAYRRRVQFVADLDENFLLRADHRVEVSNSRGDLRQLPLLNRDLLPQRDHLTDEVPNLRVVTPRHMDGLRLLHEPPSQTTALLRNDAPHASSFGGISANLPMTADVHRRAAAAICTRQIPIAQRNAAHAAAQRGATRFRSSRRIARPREAQAAICRGHRATCRIPS